MREGVEHALKMRRRRLRAPVADFRRPAEGDEIKVLALAVAQQQRAGDAVEHVGGRRAAAPLFEPGVPGRADIGALRHLLAPQPRRAPPRQRQAEGGGIEPRPPAAQKIAERVFGAGVHTVDPSAKPQHACAPAPVQAGA